MRLRVYIAGPLSKGDLCENVNRATAAFNELAAAGLAPHCPLWSVYAKPAEKWTRWGDIKAVLCEATIDGNGRTTHDEWLEIDLAWVEASEALLRLPGESSGADQEVSHAHEKGVPVFRSVQEVIEYANHLKTLCLTL